MQMNYTSTRGSAPIVSATRAIINGLAGDRGLYVPERLPGLPRLLQDWKGTRYQDLAQDIIGSFLKDFPEESVRTCIERAYDDKFEAKTVVPLVQAGDAFFLELFHGPTAAFKDMALSLLPHLLTDALELQGDASRVAVLTATSGDTGKAALEGFANVPGTDILVFYPHVGVSQVQQRQMTTQEGDNTHVFGIRGNFDDAQRAVKQIFNDPEMAQLLRRRGIRFSSANSINIGRLVPQVAYYVWAYVKLLERGIVSEGSPVNIAVPTGNFGNILAAYYAGEMGVPINRLICASNRNHVLTDFIETGCYDIRRDFHVTSSPSMDILVSSNLERLLFHLSDGDAGHVAALMEDLEEKKHYQAGETIEKHLNRFYGGYATEEETRDAMGDCYRQFNYLMDPHTAVGYQVYRRYREETGDQTPTVIAATASPYKFAETAIEALQLPTQVDGFAAVHALHQATGVPIPVGLKGLENRAIRHAQVIDREVIGKTVLQCLK